MSASRSTVGAVTAALCLALLVPVLAPTSPAAMARPAAFADPAFQLVWDRTDLAVDSGLVARSWVWGPDAFFTGNEPYEQGPGGRHLVSYFDKSRMEINNPSADRNSQWFVTNGLLVVEMMSGQVQVGDNRFLPAEAADVPVAGDANGSPNTPTFASLARFASLRGDNRADYRVGQAVLEGVGRSGGVGTVPNLSGFARYAAYEPATGHNIADVFWNYLQETGPVYQNGQYVNAALLDWVFVMGYPVTEPYWISITVGGQERWVLMQAFQRRILTYTPGNPEGWKVEMGNVGRAYYDWRYRQQAQPPAVPSPIPQARPPASISLGAPGGAANSLLRVRGRDFPPNAQVAIGVEKSTVGYYREVAAVTANAEGAFSLNVVIPDDVGKLERVMITATTSGGAVKAAQSYLIAGLRPSSREVAGGGSFTVEGVSFLPNQAIRLGFKEARGGKLDWTTSTTSDGEGYFVADVPVGDYEVGTQLKPVAETTAGVFVEAVEEVRVIPLPNLTAEPRSGPPGVTITVRGSYWPPNRDVRVGRIPVDSKSPVWLPDTVRADAAGNIRATIYIGPEYAAKNEARLVALEPMSNVRVEGTYRITR